eukprot:CAMPEP_0119328174 /NCGR_PEP_ID=MMETSP1333-20130426/72648_1 /TAXON_ID=418940 /ORGANISM="Scyphosphaera apsteinii, Strain RCC1455" /LENGTH=48 /DNA_ID= /DNA_START= /DNA_END= /DNA_ORIENTATION=
MASSERVMMSGSAAFAWGATDVDRTDVAAPARGRAGWEEAEERAAVKE